MRIGGKLFLFLKRRLPKETFPFKTYLLRSSDPQNLLNSYQPKEERLNVWSHAIGLVLSVVGLSLLILRALDSKEAQVLVSSVIFGASMILLYAASTFYHNCKTEGLRYKLKILDHISIYILIAGTYTPFCLISLKGTTGWILFGITWGFALAGLILKLFFTGRFRTFSTLIYVLMGWLIVFAIEPLMHNLPPEALFWIIAGGISYTLGAVIYSIRSIKFNHAVFHLFVLIGTFCHFMAIYKYVLPG